jgi:hypothetical protein
MSEQAQRTYIGWDSAQVTQSQADFLQSEDPTLSDTDAFMKACEDSFLQEDAYNDFIEDLNTELSKRKFKSNKWYATVTGFGRRGLSGEATFMADNGRDFLRGILPDTDCSFKVYTDNPKKLSIQNWHHDSPMGNEWYEVSPKR